MPRSLVPTQRDPEASPAIELTAVGPRPAFAPQYWSTRGDRRLKPPEDVPIQTEPSRSVITARSDGSETAASFAARSKRPSWKRYKPLFRAPIQIDPSLHSARALRFA